MATRLFDGIDDRLDTGLSQTKGSTNSMSAYAWIKTTDLDAGMKDILGLINAFDADQRLQFRQGYSSSAGDFYLVLETWGQGTGNQRFCTSLQAGDPRGVCMFVAWVNDVTNSRTRYFWGLTVDTIHEVDVAEMIVAGHPIPDATDVVFKQVALSSCRINLAAMGRESFNAQNYWYGYLSGVGLEFDTEFTLAQLKLRAAAGSVGAGSYYWPIDGSTPEPGIDTIYGTTVEEITRCGEVIPVVPVIGNQLITCM